MDENYARKLRNWLRAEPGATPSGTSEEREWLREIPEPATDEQADTPDRWTVRGQLPEPPAADDEWICPVITLPVQRSSRENGCRISGIEIRWSPPARVGGRAGTRGVSRMSRAEASQPTNADGHAEAPDVSRMGDAEAPASPMTEAEARSRWNHPTNWHRRRRAAEDQRRDQPGSH
ncbi:hypothetical protein AMES_0812 [Amycolatopsis mediterranei S699]|uniref:Uncharacterized protein n=2 Tax=Amycolatopsis mediterranei TaxID=33910 RepID=A0A0H3CXG7_AMYMU|nr:hypothetical protein [Amycolatopsis mediterranei]ADJ42634.1 hypothetical protein AMED_0814 [Amycolatopsis mediterranei U32]AEK39324.1 hypothetical protein RAM_04160 [Amycolatopsis mediterranei S699]AFO74348.1 hypothetical protein AMES_0812 [Amycolatopsis mediterranei S699]AGT81477.1 hypothetical protein B737_0813 [Amycolatopsis mediterranei RB]KDO10066.1 hypothetical protein DV26_15415 [Amycolatopsis mediterranei]